MIIIVFIITIIRYEINYPSSTKSNVEFSSSHLIFKDINQM